MFTFPDMYSRSIPLNFNGKETFSNMTSICLSILTYVGALSVFAFKIYRYIEDSQAVFTFQERSLTETEDISWNVDAFDMAISLRSLSKATLVPLTTVSGQLRNQKVSINGVSEHYPGNEIISCQSVESRSGSIREKLEKLGLSQDLAKFACIDFENSLLFGGDLLTQGFNQQVRGELTLRTNQEYSEIKEEHLFSVSLTKYLPDLYSNEGYSRFEAEETLPFEFGNEYLLNVKLSKNKVISNNNMLFELIPHEENSFFKVESLNLLRNKQIQSKNELNLKIVFEIDKTEKSYFRSYKGLDSMLAEGLAILQVITFLSKIAVNFTFHNSLYLEIGKKMVRLRIIPLKKEERKLIFKETLSNTEIALFTATSQYLNKRVKDFLSLEQRIIKNWNKTEQDPIEQSSANLMNGNQSVKIIKIDRLKK